MIYTTGNVLVPYCLPVVAFRTYFMFCEYSFSGNCKDAVGPLYFMRIVVESSFRDVISNEKFEYESVEFHCKSTQDANGWV